MIELARRARREGRTKNDLAKVEVRPKCKHHGGIKVRDGIALALAHDELAKTA